MNVKELCHNAEILRSCVYVYGAKYQIVTEELLQTLKLQNKSTYTDSYLAKCRKKIGKYGIDCSGLICKAAKISNIGSYQMKERWRAISEPVCGSVAWKPGHVALVYSVLESGTKVYVIEAKGVDYDVCFNTYDISHFKSYLLIPAVSYDKQENDSDKQSQWVKTDEGKWRYRDKDAYLQNCVKELEWSQGRAYFAFDKEGYMVEHAGIFVTDDNGVIRSVKCL